MEVMEEAGRRDRIGRLSIPEQRREELLSQYNDSGMTQAAFARRAGVRYPTFAHWVQQARKKGVRRADAGRAADAARFVEVSAGLQRRAPASTSELSVALPGGLVARGADAGALSMLVRALLGRG